MRNEFHLTDGFILQSYFAIKQLAQSDAKAFGLDTSDTRVEKIPLVVNPVSDLKMKRIKAKTNACRCLRGQSSLRGEEKKK